MKKSLDLGCGDNLKNPFEAEIVYGIDVREDLEKNIYKSDLVIEKIPFDDNYFEYISAFDFIEHIPRLIYCPERRYPFVELMNEIYRVLKPGGIFLSVTPGVPNLQAFQDPTHVNFITEETFEKYFTQNYLYAKMYGFNGSFSIEKQHWHSFQLVTYLKKL
jgi:SAM-dependent methyltransferase